MKRFFLLTVCLFFIIFFLLLLRLIHQPVIDLDEGIYTTTFSLMQQGNPAYATTFLSQPPGFLLAIYPGFVAFGSDLLAARLSMSLWLIVGLVSIVWLCWEIKKPYMSYLIFGIIFFAPSISSRFFIVQSDMLVSTFSLMCVAAYVRFHNSKNVFWLIFSAIWFGLSLWTKYSLFLFIPVGSLFYFSHTTHNSFKKTFFFLSCFFLTILSLSLPIVFAFGIQNIISNTIQIRLVSYALGAGNFLFYLNQDPLLLLLTIATIVLFLFSKNRLRSPVAPIFLWTTTIFIILSFYHPLFQHHLTLFFIPLIILFSMLIFDVFHQYARLLFIASLSIFVGGFLFYTVTFLPKTGTALATLNEQKIVAIIARNSSPKDTILTDDEILYSFSKRYPSPKLSDTSYVRIAADNMSSHTVEKSLMDHPPKLIIPLTGRLVTIHNFSQILKKYRQVKEGDITYYILP